MSLGDINPHDITIIALAKVMLRQFGEQAARLADEQAGSAAADPATRTRWERVSQAAAALCAAGWHMETALALLDDAGETKAAPLLDHAIERLGLRRGQAVDGHA